MAFAADVTTSYEVLWNRSPMMPQIKMAAPRSPFQKHDQINALQP